MTNVLRGDEEDLYREHHARLRAQVRAVIHGPDELVDDACAGAWMILMRAQPDRTGSLFQWLRACAIREAWRLSERDRRELPLPATDFEDRSADVDTRLRALEALRALAGLRERPRRYLTQLVAGHSYQEIGEREGVTYTNVNRHIARGRRALKEATP